jgi:hypothetical protein
LNHFSSATKTLFLLFSFVGALTLSGCAIDPSAASNDAAATASVHPGALKGSNFGGHAPIVGSKVFLLQAGTGGYGSVATSLLTASAGGTDTTVVGPSQSAQAWQSAGTAHYVTTDGAGDFDITGDYACTPGLPVYLYAYSGAPDSNPAVGYSTLVSGSYTSAANVSPATGYTVTYTLVVNQQKFYPGQTVSFTITPGQTVPAFASLDGQTGVVLSVNPNNVNTLQNTTFSVAVQSATAPSPSLGFGNFAGVSVVTPIGVQNPAVVNVAVLGNCPSSGATNFGASSNNPISFVYMNEVATAAAMFALAPFAETSTISGGVVSRTGTDAQHIGIPPGDSLALTGIQNAAANAGQLYDITGGNNSGTTDGEGHVARTTVPGSSTGIVPQALIDTLGNILAACVDSANTAGLGVTGGTYSPACSTLFNTATADGTTSGTKPTDIATAAINIAHYPAGVGNASFISNLYNLPGIIVPFSPYLTTQPNDFTIGIDITAGSIFLGTNAVPQGIATDSNGNAFVTTTGCVNGCVVQLSPTQVAAGISYASGGTAVAVDATGRVWVTNASQAPAGGSGAPTGAFYVASALPLSASSFTGYGNTTDFPSGTLSIAIDGNGVAYVSDSAQSYIHKISALGTAPAYTQYLMQGQTGSQSGQLNCEVNVQAIAVDSRANGYNIWTDDNAQTATQGMCTVSNVALQAATTATSPVNTAAVLSQFGPQFNPGGVAIDANGNGWGSNSPSPNNTAEQFPGTFGSGQYSGNFGFGFNGGLNGDYGVAVDGNDNIWYANVAGNSVSLFKNLGTATAQAQVSATAISPSLGYTAGGIMSGPKQIAIDLSGDVWVTNTSSSGAGYSVTELIGAAAPTYTPLALAAKNNKLGAKP